MNIKKSKLKVTMFITMVFVALIGVILMFIESYNHDSTSRDHWILYLYVTFQANFIIVIYFLLRLTNIINRNKHWEQLFQIIVVANIMIVMIVFWTILFPMNPHFASRLNGLETFWVHLITPILAIVLFFVELYYYPKKYHVKNCDLLYILLYPIIWMMMAIIVYFSAHVAIYSFLDFKVHPLIAGLSIPAITLLFALIGYLFISFTNHSKIYHFFLKNKKKTKL